MTATDPEGANAEGERAASHVLRVFREVWDEFYVLETFSSKQGLEELASSRPGSPALDFGLNIRDEDIIRETSLESQAVNKDTNAFIIYSFSDEGFLTKDALKVSRGIQTSSDEYFTEHPPFESCRPTLTNVLLGDDSDDAPFVPYADDSSFDHRAYMDEHRGMSWQNPRMTSPHGVWITLETGRRLVGRYGLDLVAIDKTGILPVPLLCTSDEWGAIIMSQNMDCPSTFFGQAGNYKELSDASLPAVDDLSKRVQRGLSIFCSNLNCIQTYCYIHNGEKHQLDTDDRYVAYAGVYLPPPATQPCGKGCYLFTNSIDEDRQRGKRKRNGMKSQDIESLKLLFRISPEATSCEIGQLMQYRCYEVHSQRLEYHRRARDRLLFKERSEPASSYIPHAHSKDASSNGVNNHNVLKHFEPCSHAGPCGGAAGGCTCRDSDSHCERSCCCTADCPRRFSGCDCARLQLKMRKQPHPEECYEPEPDLCISHECPCVKNGRECDPELCDCLHYTCSDEDVECKNADLRRERGKQLRVGPSVFGLGVFLEEHVQRGELICEYVGELTYDATTETRGLLAQHRGRAYVFKLNNTFDVDASYAGNIARFINHAPSRRANCTTIIMNVSSDQRIGLYAKKSMVSGTELTIDYGDDFFTTETKASSVSSRTTEKSRSSTESASTR